jgi:predicted secreted Zn-dependent protease
VNHARTPIADGVKRGLALDHPWRMLRSGLGQISMTCTWTKHVAAKLLGVALAVFVTGGFGPVETRIDIDPYPISGKTRGQLVDSVKMHGPMGGRVYGIGFIDFDPRFQTKSDKGLCRVTSAETGLRVNLRVPEWRGGPEAPKGIARVARNFERVVRAHEMQHVAIARSWQKRMTSMLKALKADKDCYALRNRADESIRRLKAQHRDAQRAFDKRTYRQLARLL